MLNDLVTVMYTVPRDRPSPAADRWELDGLARLARVRDVTEAMLMGHWTADTGTAEAIAALAESAAQRLRWRDSCRAA